jgi:hypothetical protein
MICRAEAILPPKVTMGTLRVQAYDEDTHDQLMRENINLVDERRWQSAIKMHGTTKHSNATKSGLCIAESSRWKI